MTPPSTAHSELSRSFRFSALLALLAGSATLAAPLPEAILDRNGDPAWAGAYLLDGAAEAAKPLLTLPRASRVAVHLDREERGYVFVDTIGQAAARSGWVHRKFLKFPGAAEVAATPSPAPAAAPANAARAETPRPPTSPAGDRARMERLEEQLRVVQKRLEAAESRNDELQKRMGTLEKNGGQDPGVDFLQRLQKLEMEVHSRETSALPTVPFPEPQKRQEEARSDASAAPARVPSMSWIFKGW